MDFLALNLSHNLEPTWRIGRVCSATTTSRSILSATPLPGIARQPEPGPTIFQALREQLGMKPSDSIR
jgi:hypothetical protein